MQATCVPMGRTASRSRLPSRVKAYLFVLLFALPIDYFRPTGALLREAGAKPAIPVMLVGCIWILYRHWPELLFRCPRLWRTILLLCSTVILLSVFAFITNVGLGISYWGGLRSPWGQFFSQGLLFVLVAPVLITHAWLFSQEHIKSFVIRIIPPIAFIHLLLIYVEWAGLLRATSFPLTLFRGTLIVYGRKPTGLMTEPSYVGVFAAMYGLALLLCMPRKRRRDQLLAVASMATALLIGGKTLLPVLAAGLLAYGYQIRARLFNWKSISAFVAVTVVALYTIATYSVLDVRANLSSAMRLGSLLLALNAAAAGYGLLA